jgi:Tfp pilus assembly protein PilF
MSPRIRVLFRRTAAACALVLSACATHFVCPAHGGREWREVRSPHFAIATDLGSAAARRIANDLEVTRMVITSVLPSSDSAHGEIVQVVAFASHREFEEFAPPRADGYYRDGAFGEPTVVMPGNLGPVQRAVIAHELTHHFEARVFARMPRWAFEGLATYMETIGYAGRENGFAEAGAVSLGHLQIALGSGGSQASLGPLDSNGSMPSVRLVLGRDARFDSREAYAMAWALVFFLVNRHGDQFQQLLRRFKAGEDGRAAWLAVFPEWDPGRGDRMRALDMAIRTFLRGGTYRPTLVELPQGEAQTTERPLSSTAVHDLTLPLRAGLKSTTRAALLAEVAEALEEDPASIVAAMVLAGMHDARALGLARAATRAHRDDYRSWLLLSMLLPADDEVGREEALRQALAAGGATYLVYNDLAWLLYKQQRPAEGLDLAREAVARAPWDPHSLDTLAALLGALQRCEEGAAYERRALDLLAEGATEQLRTELQRRLKELENCRAQAALTPPRPY